MANHRFRITAFIYDKRGRLLSTGHNSYIKTHTLQAKYATAAGKPDAIYLHAEVAAIVKLRNWKEAYKITIVRYTRKGESALASPCAICRSVIKQTGIKEICYTT